MRSFHIMILLLVRYVYPSVNQCLEKGKKAYVITMKTILPPDTIASISALGFVAQIVPAIQPFKELFSDKASLYNFCFNVSSNKNFMTYESTRFKTLTTLELSLVCSHYKVINQIAVNECSTDDEWAIIMEDDAILVPSVNSSTARNLFLSATVRSDQINGEEGFIYLGLCSSKCRTIDENNDLGIDCYGLCTHAYAVKKLTSKTIFSKFYSEKVLTTSSLQSDQAYWYYFKNTPLNQRIQPILVGNSIVSPDNKGHTGIFFQCNRTSPNRGTSLTSDAFKPMKCFELKLVASTIGEVLLEYALVAEFCMKNNLQPLYCSALTKHSKDLLRSNYSNSLQQLALLDCKEPRFITIVRNALYYNPDLGDHNSSNLLLYSNNTVSNIFEINIRSYLTELYRSSKYESSVIAVTNHSLDDRTVCLCLPISFHKRNESMVHQFYRNALIYLLSLTNDAVINIVFFKENSIDSDDYGIVKDLQSQFNLSIVADRIFYLNGLSLINNIAECKKIVVSNSLNYWWGAYLAGVSAIVVAMKHSHYNAKSSNWVYI